MVQEELRQLFSTFGKAYFRADEALLKKCTTGDFQWHQHSGTPPTGNILKGVEAVCKEIKCRKEKWKDVLYEDFETLFTETMIISKFTVSGIDEIDRPFKARAVDLYSIVEDKISLKDSFWKYV